MSTWQPVEAGRLLQKLSTYRREGEPAKHETNALQRASILTTAHECWRSWLQMRHFQDALVLARPTASYHVDATGRVRFTSHRVKEMRSVSP